MLRGQQHSRAQRVDTEMTLGRTKSYPSQAPGRAMW